MNWMGYNLREPKRAQTFGVISIKGGVGKTTTVLSLGAALAHDFNKKVLLVDANFSAPNLGMHIGLVHPEKNLNQVLQNKASSREAVYNHEYGFDILPSSLIPSQVEPGKLDKRLEPLRNDYDIILVDSSPNLNEEMLATMMASDELLVVSTPDHPTLSATMHAVKVAKSKEIPIAGIILNKKRGKQFEITIDEVEDAAETPVLAVLPDDLAVLEALAHTRPVTMHSPLSETVLEYKKLAGCLVGEQFRDPRFKQRFKERILGKIDKQAVNRDLFRETKRN